MGSLPDLTRAPPAPPPAAPARARTLAAAPQRLNQPLPHSKAEWVRAARRRESVASSTGAASVRRLLVKAPPRPPRALLYRFAALCAARALLAAALLPLTALRGAGGRRGAAELALMHACAALSAPAAPALARRMPPHFLALATHAPLALLAGALAGGATGGAMLPLYAAAGLGAAPLALAGGAASTALAGALAGGEEGRKRVALRRSLRALRAAHDVGLLAGALALAAALAAWPPAPQLIGVNATQAAPRDNRTTPRWPPSSDFFMDDFDDEEEATCGASGCPSAAESETPPLSTRGWRALAGTWAAVVVASGALAAASARGAQPPAAELAPGPPPLRDLRTLLALPLSAFIGMQEGFIYTSYIKWYAVCVGGWGAGWAALAGSGALQTLAAATLSMAAARGRRGALAAGGFAAHACLLLALLRWRAARADVALPGVAAAAWGVCGALWDTLQSGISIGSGGAWGTNWRGPYAYLSAARHAGVALACAARASLCVRTQLAALAAALVLGAAAHAALELRVRRARKPVRATGG